MEQIFGENTDTETISSTLELGLIMSAVLLRTSSPVPSLCLLDYSVGVHKLGIGLPEPLVTSQNLYSHCIRSNVEPF